VFHVHVRIHRWVVWWFYLGIAGGIVALVNILGRDLTRSTEHVLLVLGVIHWLLGGLVCWSLEGIQIHVPQPARKISQQVRLGFHEGPHHVSEYVLPGGGKTWLTRKY
jgi:hypothetical protein